MSIFVEFIMKKIIVILLGIVILNCFLLADDSFFYTVPCGKFDKKIYNESLSEYNIISCNQLILPDTPYQHVFAPEKSGDVFKMKLKAGYPVNDNNTQNLKSLNEYLINTRLLEIDDPEIIKLKQNFYMSEDIVSDVEKYVYNHITDKKIGIPIISASKILIGRAGDCTEHAVLAISILRMLGIRARAVVGMILSEEFDGNENVFVYHMWAEAYYKNRWMLVDATRPEEKFPNRYIAIAYHHLKTEMPLDYLKAVSAMKSFSIEYVADAR
jgi:transglutaminase-like putative cysteine protease